MPGKTFRVTPFQLTFGVISFSSFPQHELVLFISGDKKYLSAERLLCSAGSGKSGNFYYFPPAIKRSKFPEVYFFYSMSSFLKVCSAPFLENSTLYCL